MEMLGNGKSRMGLDLDLGWIVVDAIDWQALRLAWGEWAQRKPVKVRASRQWTRSESSCLFGEEVNDDPVVFSSGEFTTSASTYPPSSPDKLIPNVRAWLSTEPPPLPFGMYDGDDF